MALRFQLLLATAFGSTRAPERQALVENLLYAVPDRKLQHFSVAP